MHNAFQGVQAANIEWRKIESGNQPYFAPYSVNFDDVYFNTIGGIEESQYVFIDGNDLTERFKSNLNDFVIFETGFGSGLNFLLTADLWTQQNTQGHLHYYSIEQFPIRPIDLEKVYAQLELVNLFPKNQLSEKLIQQYPPILQGVYPIEISERITLHLVFYPMNTGLKELSVNNNFKVDAWFLDGFAPSSNPEMWHKGLWHFMALHAVNDQQRQTSVATFTAASEVRKMLTNYGFKVSKRNGFGKKREMLIAEFEQKNLSSNQLELTSSYLKNKPKAKKIAVIGSGLAGCTTAYCLKKSGFNVHVFEQGSEIASGASKMPALLAMPNFSLDHNPYSQLTFHGFNCLMQFCLENPQLVSSWEALQIESDKYSRQQLEDYLSLYQDRLSGRLQWTDESTASLNKEGLTVPAIQVNGRSFCDFLLKEISQSKIHLNTKIDSLAQLSEFDQIILCTGHQTFLNDLGIINLPGITPLRGQLTSIEAPQNLANPINYDGHLSQEQNDWILGATFTQSTDEAIDLNDGRLNIEQANKQLGLKLPVDNKSKQYVGIRASTADRFPNCGLLKTQTEQSIWLNYGYGTRGLCLSLLGAKVLTQSIANKTVPLNKNILKRINPNRLNT